jgi:hypothetical protein
MPIFSKLMFQAVRWASRRGLREEEGFSNDTKKLEARRTGVAEKPTPIGICEGMVTYSWHGITLREG